MKKGVSILNIGKKIKFLRHQRHLSRKELCQMSGVTVSDIKKYENGDTDDMTVKTLKNIADAFMCGVDDLVDSEFNATVKEMLKKWEEKFSNPEFYENTDFVIHILRRMIDCNIKNQGTRLISYNIGFQNLFIEGLINYLLSKKNQD